MICGRVSFASVEAVDIFHSAIMAELSFYSRVDNAGTL